jgi:hypothetical protein
LRKVIGPSLHSVKRRLLFIIHVYLFKIEFLVNEWDYSF